MVERPIKKSERQAQANTDNNSENSDSAPSIESHPKRSNSRDNRSSGKRKKDSAKDEIKQQVNPALARGPKPVKAPVIVKSEPETDAEQVSEESPSEES
ncbi:hypothetical protein NIES21_29750 [Anabaenopsis circularis NIES-21]|uniref:Uncharacterized protein n=2 Tax=Nostocales TaxID=1161 RepID=A0A1Z4GI20_9CYAN|nr:hypothetical protein [Nostoc cycadae]BAY17140.1 hypothetical protein NIES21_29750 [Anabaenopsis circularis NIES-21]GBE92085.1 sodium-dependent phosphate transporter 2 [Nostoc cycadae WK-1]